VHLQSCVAVQLGKLRSSFHTCDANLIIPVLLCSWLEFVCALQVQALQQKAKEENCEVIVVSAQVLVHS